MPERARDSGIRARRGDWGLAGVDMEAPEECSPRGCRWRPPRGSALPSFLAATDSLPAEENRTPLPLVHWPRGRGRVDEHGQEPSDRHVQRDREVPVGEVDPPALPYRAAEDRPQPLLRVRAGEGLGRHWDRWLPKDCAHSSSLPSVGCRAAGATSTSSGYSRARRSARTRTLTGARAGLAPGRSTLWSDMRTPRRVTPGALDYTCWSWPSPGGRARNLPASARLPGDSSVSRRS